MMRLVVTNGTAKDLQGAGDVRGKTGEAEFAGGSHSWFAGYRGDMAFAALDRRGRVLGVRGADAQGHVRLAAAELPGLSLRAVRSHTAAAVPLNRYDRAR